MSTKYPTREQIAELCDNLSNGNPDRFFARVSPDVDWELMGRHPLAGRFTSLDEWKAKALQPINAVLKEPLRLKVRNIIGGGDQEWAVVELFADATCKNGMDYPQRYSWVMRFDDTGIIVQVRAYLDSALVEMALQQPA